MFPNNIRISSQPQKAQGCQWLSRGWDGVPHMRCQRRWSYAVKMAVWQPRPFNFDDCRQILIVGSFVLDGFGPKIHYVCNI